MMYKTLKVEALKKLVFQVLLSAGETEENAGIIFENLLEDEYMNKPTHGFYRIPSIVEALKTRNAVLPVKISQSNSIFSVDGQRNIGLVAVRKACDSIIAASKEQPLVMAGIFNYISTTGAIGYYTRYLARNGLISIMTCISGATVVPHGGMDPLFGTNPISVGIPYQDNPVITDVATAAISYGQLALLAKAGTSVSPNTILDKEGYPSTDPKDVTERGGTQLPLSGHKGYSLGLVFEILAGLLVGARSKNSASPDTDGALLIAFKPDVFIERNDFDRELDTFLMKIKNSRPAPGSDGIRIPGQYDTISYEKKKQSGEITIMDKVYEDIVSCL